MGNGKTTVAEAGRKGGESTSRAKQEAARANGRGKKAIGEMVKKK